MTDYTKENHWYGHNGELMPVHPSTQVELVFLAEYEPHVYIGSAFGAPWELCGAFRITRLYREPRKAREWWVNRYYGSDGDDTLFASRAEADSAALDENRIECIHVREVLPEGDA